MHACPKKDKSISSNWNWNLNMALDIAHTHTHVACSTHSSWESATTLTSSEHIMIRWKSFDWSMHIKSQLKVEEKTFHQLCFQHQLDSISNWLSFNHRVLWPWIMRNFSNWLQSIRWIGMALSFLQKKISKVENGRDHVSFLFLFGEFQFKVRISSCFQ